MSRLVNPGAGDIADRLTILALKILHGQAAGKDVAHFISERNSLLVLLRNRELNGSWFEHVLTLAAVNAALWQRTDEMRLLLRLRGLDGAWPTAERVLEAANCGCAILQLNDDRARLVRLINELSGDVPKDAGQEKL